MPPYLHSISQGHLRRHDELCEAGLIDIRHRLLSKCRYAIAKAPTCFAATTSSPYRPTQKATAEAAIGQQPAGIFAERRHAELLRDAINVPLSMPFSGRHFSYQLADARCSNINAIPYLNIRQQMHDKRVSRAGRKCQPSRRHRKPSLT